jgi:hypothetical protein
MIATICRFGRAGCATTCPSIALPVLSFAKDGGVDAGLGVAAAALVRCAAAAKTAQEAKNAGKPCISRA